MSYIDHVIRDTYVPVPTEFLETGKSYSLQERKHRIYYFFSSKESYEVYTMGENTNGSLGHSQVIADQIKITSIPLFCIP